MIPSTSKIALFTGATGTTGSALLRLLEAKGVAVRAMLRRQGNVSRLGSATAAPVDGVSGRDLTPSTKNRLPDLTASTFA
jgi:uncharacterized protein YbjT (DUF2867 family)